jgi:hypothetical protein
MTKPGREVRRGTKTRSTNVEPGWRLGKGLTAALRVLASSSGCCQRMDGRRGGGWVDGKGVPSRSTEPQEKFGRHLRARMNLMKRALLRSGVTPFRRRLAPITIMVLNRTRGSFSTYLPPPRRTFSFPPLAGPMLQKHRVDPPSAAFPLRFR